MTSSYGIDAPHTISTLPRPLDIVAGRTLTGGSYTVESSKKRKRSEVVVGVDGESINIYDLKTPRLLTSHAIPPQAYLTARPCCAQARSSAPGRSTERFTYAALRNELGNSKHEIVCFRETLVKPSRNAASPASLPIKTTFSLGSRDNPILFAEPILRSHQDDDTLPHELVVVRENGDIVGLSGDASKEMWRTSIEKLSASSNSVGSSSNKTHHVKHVFTQNAAVASRGMLKGREDLVAVLDPTGQKEDGVLERTTILCLVTSSVNTGASEQTQNIHVLAAKPSATGSHGNSPLQMLVGWQLSSSKSNTGTQTKSEYAIDSTSGTLFQLVDGTLVTYNFSALGPKIWTKLQLPQAHIEDFVPVSHGMAIIAAQNHCSLFNMRYTSLQASIKLSEAYLPQSHGRKRRRTTNDFADSSVRFLDYFPRDNIVAAIVANDLVILSIRLPPVERRRIGAKSGRLIDSLGHGIPPPGNQTRIAPAVFDVDAVSAFARSDLSLELLSQKVNQGKMMTLSGAAEALKHLLRSYNTPTPKVVPQTSLLTNGTSGNDAESLESTFDAEDAALSADLALASSLLSSSALAARATALKSAVLRLGISFSTHSVSQALRHYLERRDILFLIELLRLDLERGGWTSRCLDVWPETNEATSNTKNEKGPDAAISVVCKVLNCALDALGMGAWVAPTHTSEEDEFMREDGEQQGDATHHTISLLRAETEAVLECVQECAFFTGFLGEFIRYERALEKAPKGASSSAIIAENPNTIPLGVQKAVESATSVGVQESMLPLGVHAAQGVAKISIGAGGEVRKTSKRSIANAKSRRTEIYAFERIRV